MRPLASTPSQPFLDNAPVGFGPDSSDIKQTSLDAAGTGSPLLALENSSVALQHPFLL